MGAAQAINNVGNGHQAMAWRMAVPNISSTSQFPDFCNFLFPAWYEVLIKFNLN